MITAISDFTGEIQIANKTQPDVNAPVNGFIAKYEPIFLRELLGSDFAALFIAGLAVIPVDARWTALLTPNMYSLKTAIDNYIYYWYMRDLETQSVGVGEKLAAAANAVNASAAKKVNRAWFEMVKTAWQTIRFLNDNSDTYPEYVLPNWYRIFALSWRIWGFGDDIFTAPFFYGWYTSYCIPDIFVPLNRYY